MSQQQIATSLLTYPLLNADVSTGAAIEASKLRHQRYLLSDMGLNADDAPVTTTKVVLVPPNSCTLKSFRAMLTNTGTTTDVDFDVKINGTTALTAAINITNAETNNVMYAGTLTTTDVNADDVVTFEMTVTSSTGALGPAIELVFDTTYTG